MNLRNALIALVVLAVLVVVLVLVFREPPPEELKVGFPEIKKDHVTKIWIRGPVPQTEEEKKEARKPVFEEVTLERSGEGEEATWSLTSPVAYPAYKSYVDTLLTRLEEMKIVDLAVESKKNWVPLEVDAEHAVHVKVWAQGSLLADFHVGAYKTGNTMLRLEGDERVYKVQGSVRYVFGKRTRDWRDKTILDRTADHVAHVTYTSPDGRFEFDRAGAEWSQVLAKDEPPIEGFDGRKVRSFISSLAKLRASDFADGVAPADAGLSPAQAEVSFTLNIPPDKPDVEDADEVKAEQDGGASSMEPEYTVETYKVLLGNPKDKDEKDFYLMIDGSPQVYLVTKYVADRLRPKAADFTAPPKPEKPAGVVPPPPGGPGEAPGSTIPPEVMKQVQAEIQKQKMMKKLMEKAGQPSGSSTP